jgi:hypothetical protein
MASAWAMLRRAPSPSSVIGIGAGAVAHHFRQRHGAARQGMVQPLQHQGACAFAHHEAVSARVEGARGLFGAVVVARGQGLGCRECAQAHAVDGSLGPATQGHVGLARADQPQAVAYGLHTGSAGRDRSTQRALESVAYGDMAGREIDQEGRHRERRQARHATAIRGAHGLGNGAEAADARADDAGSARTRLLAGRLPAGLGQSLVRSVQRQRNEAVHLALVLGRDHGIDIPAAFRIPWQVGHLAGHLRRHIGRQSLRQAAQPRCARQQAPPGHFGAPPQGRDHAHACNDHTACEMARAHERSLMMHAEAGARTGRRLLGIGEAFIGSSL